MCGRIASTSISSCGLTATCVCVCVCSWSCLETFSFDKTCCEKCSSVQMSAEFCPCSCWRAHPRIIACNQQRVKALVKQMHISEAPRGAICNRHALSACMPICIYVPAKPSGSRNWRRGPATAAEPATRRTGVNFCEKTAWR